MGKKEIKKDEIKREEIKRNEIKREERNREQIMGNETDKRKRKGKRYSCNCISLFIPFSALSCTDLSAVHGNVKKFSQNQKINERMQNV